MGSKNPVKSLSAWLEGKEYRVKMHGWIPESQWHALNTCTKIQERLRRFPYKIPSVTHKETSQGMMVLQPGNNFTVYTCNVHDASLLCTYQAMGGPKNQSVIDGLHDVLDGACGHNQRELDTYHTFPLLGNRYMPTAIHKCCS